MQGLLNVKGMSISLAVFTFTVEIFKAHTFCEEWEIHILNIVSYDATSKSC